MIYADFNATSPLGQAARLALEQACEIWGNPNSSHRLGRQALQILDRSRASLAAAVGVSLNEVVFTSGGSEANTNALLGAYFARPKEFRLLTSAVEHSSVLGTVELLRSLGVPVEQVSLSSDGELNLATFTEQIDRFQPTLVSLMTANNETGVIFPVGPIAALCKSKGILFHTDAVQAFGKIPREEWNAADLISLSAHKIYGPKGVGALIVKSGVKLVSTHFGGSQEVKRRGGTQNALGIAGFGAACESLAPPEKIEGLRKLRDDFEARLMAGAEGVSIVGKNLPRVPNTTNVRFSGVSSEVLLSALDLDGVCISAGSACSSGSIVASHVLLALGLSETEAKESIRVSWGVPSQPADVDRVAELVLNHVQRIRSRRTKTC